MKKPISSQHGYSLLELSIVMVFMAMIVIAAIMMQAEQARMDRARAIAQIYTRMNNAAGSYLVNYYPQLLSLRPECGTPYWASQGGVNAANPDFSQCAVDLTLGGKTTHVVNGLQPTPTELWNLGLLESAGASVNELPLRTLLDAANGNLYYLDPLMGGFVMGDIKGKALPNRFMVLIQFMCITGTNGGDPAVFTTSNGCSSGAYDLRSLVFNSQPYHFSSSKDSAVILYEALQAAGASAFLSGLGPGTAGGTDTGELRAMSSSVEKQIINPSRLGGWHVNAIGDITTSSGAPYIFAMRNGYGSAGWDQYVRRDGSTPMSNKWDYGNQNISNVNNLDVNNKVTIGQLDPATNTGNGNLTVNGDSQTNGIASATTGVFGNLTGPFTAALNATSGFIQGALNVGGALVADTFNVVKTSVFGGASTFNGQMNVNGGLTTANNSQSTFNGPVDLKGPTNIYQFKLNAESYLGTACDPTAETIRKQIVDNSFAPYKKGLRLLVCDKATSKWVMPQPDLQGDIDTMTGSINTLTGEYADLLAQIQELKKNSGGIGDYVTYDLGWVQQGITDTQYSCREWAPPVLSTYWIYDMGKWESSSVNAYCDGNYTWHIQYYHPKTTIYMRWVLFKKKVPSDPPAYTGFSF